MKQRTKFRIKDLVKRNALLFSLILSIAAACIIGCAVNPSGKPIDTLMRWIKGDSEPDDSDHNNVSESEEEFDPSFDTTSSSDSEPEDTSPMGTGHGSDEPAETDPADTVPAVIDPDVDARRNDPNYYNDVLFIGDSRTVGLSLYGNISGATYYAKTSMSVFNCFNINSSETGPNKPLLDYLKDHKFGKIYILLGINEIGYPINNIANKYKALITQIRELQSDAIIVIQSNMNVTKTKSNNNPDTFNNNRINQLNSKLEMLANDETIYYINICPLFNDENGCMIDEYTGDGVHLKGKYYSIWSDYLNTDGRR